MANQFLFCTLHIGTWQTSIISVANIKPYRPGNVNLQFIIKTFSKMHAGGRSKLMKVIQKFEDQSKIVNLRWYCSSWLLHTDWNGPYI